MRDRQQYIDAETAWEIHQRELRALELRQLADSINDTARMARNTLTAALVVALYLGVTLLSSTDLNLFVNGQVVLPQVGAGISVVQSYIFAPPVFLFLHVQALFLLGALAQKVRVYQGLIADEPEPRRREYEAWLSGFAFVQLFLRERGMMHPARLLTWIGTNAVPLALLFAIDVSFVRYQSDEITLIHHGLFLVDLAVVARFNWLAFRGGPCVWWDWLVIAPWRAWRTRTVAFGAFVWGALGMLWSGVWQVVAVAMAAVLVVYAQPPRPMDGGAEAVEKQRSLIWREANETVSVPSTEEGSLETWLSALPDKAEAFRARLENGENLLDAGPCEWWGAACRYLDVRSEWLVARSAEDRFRLAPKKPNDEELLAIRRAYAEPLDVSRRRFRFARMDSVFAPEAIFKGADMSWAKAVNADLIGSDLSNVLGDSADFTEAQMQDADLSEAELRSSSLKKAKLQRANLRNTRLDNANLEKAQLLGADLGEASLQGGDLRELQLQGVNLERAKLQGANLKNTRLEGANLRDAQLQGANLEYARLNGARLEGAQLEGANLVGARLEGANLFGANLRSANLWQAQLRGAYLGESRLTGANLKQTQLQAANLGAAQLQGADLEEAQLQGAVLWETQLSGAFLKQAQFQGADLRKVDISGAYLTGAQLQGAYGQPLSVLLATMYQVSYFFPPLTKVETGDKLFKAVESFLEKHITDEMRMVKVRFRGGVTVADAVQERVMRGARLGVFNGWTPKAEDLLAHNRLLPAKWPTSPATRGDDGKPYRVAMATWFSDFACESEHTAQSSLRQWRIFWDARPNGPVKDAVRAALIQARAERSVEECHGLHAVSEEEWQEFVGD